MKFVPPTAARIQCPQCGEPVNTIELRTRGSFMVTVEPCEHIVDARWMSA